jgi:hypothetical protein
MHINLLLNSKLREFGALKVSSSANVELCGFAICRSNLFVIFGLSQVRKYILFLFTNVAYNAQIQIVHDQRSFKKRTLRTVLRQSCAAFCRNLRNCDLRTHHKNLRI